MDSINLNQYSGIIHVHSTYSDGARPVSEIMDIANELDINFLLLTDHNTLKGKEDGLEGWYNNVLLGIGAELNDRDDRNHYLSFDIPKSFPFSLESTSYIKEVHKSGGFGIVAHPFESRYKIAKYPPYPWTNWDSNLFDGMEIWNQMSEWMEGLTNFNGIRRILHPRRSIITPKKRTLKKWDEINLDRKVVGIGGVDAHGHIHKIFKLIPMRVFRYKISFKTIRTHILCQEKLDKSKPFTAGLKTVYEAIKDARCFISNYYYGDASSFRVFAENEQGRAGIGETLKYLPGTNIFVTNPREARTMLIRNGITIARENGARITFKLKESGVYRVETHVENKPWIFSNHIRLVD